MHGRQCKHVGFASVMLSAVHRYDRMDQRERDRSRKRARQVDSDDEEIIPTRSTRRRPAPGSSRRSDPGGNDSQRGIGRNTRGGLKRDDSGQVRLKLLQPELVCYVTNQAKTDALSEVSSLFTLLTGIRSQRPVTVVSMAVASCRYGICGAPLVKRPRVSGAPHSLFTVRRCR